MGILRSGILCAAMTSEGRERMVRGMVYMKRLLTYILLACVCALASPQDAQAAKSWESVRQERLSEGKVVTRTGDVEVRTLSGTILIYASRPMQVRVFSILGQLVSSETVPAGVSQLSLGSHGLFIVKVGDLTCKVAL